MKLLCYNQEDIVWLKEMAHQENPYQSKSYLFEINNANVKIK